MTARKPIVDRANVFRKSDVESHEESHEEAHADACEGAHEEAHVALYYSPVAYNRRLAELCEQGMDAVDAAERDIAQGKEVSLPEEVREFVRPRFDESGKVVGLIRDQDAFDAALLDYSHFAIASSAAGKAREILATYDLRPAPECRFDCLKGRMDLHTAAFMATGAPGPAWRWDLWQLS